MALPERYLRTEPAALDGEGDRVLVARSREGDPLAFEELYRRYLPMVKAVVSRHAPSPQSAEDCVQACFLRAFQRLDQLRDGVAFAAWLSRVAVNVCRDEHDRAALRARFATEDGEADLARVADERNDPFRLAAEHELRPALAAGVVGVSDERRRLLYLRYVAGHSVGEIARRLAASPRALSLELAAAKSQARSRIARAAVPDGAPPACVRRAAALADWVRQHAVERDAELTAHVDDCAHCSATMSNLRGLLGRHAVLPLGLLGLWRPTMVARRVANALSPALVAGAGAAVAVTLSLGGPPASPHRHVSWPQVVTAGQFPAQAPVIPPAATAPGDGAAPEGASDGVVAYPGQGGAPDASPTPGTPALPALPVAAPAAPTPIMLPTGVGVPSPPVVAPPVLPSLPSPPVS